MTAIDVDREWQLYIDGEFVTADSSYAIIDPNTTKLVGRAPEATVAQAEDAAAAAAAALGPWRRTPQAERAALMGRLADILAERTPDWAEVVRADYDLAPVEAAE